MKPSVPQRTLALRDVTGGGIWFRLPRQGRRRVPAAHPATSPHSPDHAPVASLPHLPRAQPSSSGLLAALKPNSPAQAQQRVATPGRVVTRLLESERSHHSRLALCKSLPIPPGLWREVGPSRTEHPLLHNGGENPRPWKYLRTGICLHPQLHAPPARPTCGTPPVRARETPPCRLLTEPYVARCW